MKTGDPSKDELTIDDPSAGEVVLGATAGGGGAGAAVQEDIPNPVAGIFDDVDPSPGSTKSDEILVAKNVVRRFGGLSLIHISEPTRPY